MQTQQLLNNVINSTSISTRFRKVLPIRTNNSKTPSNKFGNNDEGDSFFQIQRIDNQINEEIPKILLQSIVSLKCAEDANKHHIYRKQQNLTKLLIFAQYKDDYINSEKAFQDKERDKILKERVNALRYLEELLEYLELEQQFEQYHILEHESAADKERRDSLQSWYNSHTTHIHISDSGSIYYVVVKGGFVSLVPKPEPQNEINDREKEAQIVAEQNKKPIKRRSKTLKVGTVFSVAKDEFITSQKNIQPQEKVDGNTLNSIIQMRQANALSEFVLGDMDEDKYFKTIYPTFQKTREFTAGESFGENALLLQQKERQCTIVCSKEGFLITLDKFKYDKIVSIYQELQTRNNLEFLYKFSFLSELGPSKLLSLLQTAQIVTFKKPHVIYKEGDKSDSLYFIKSGEVKLTQLGEIVDNKVIDQRQLDIQNCQPITLNQVKQHQARQHTQTRVSLVIYQENSFFGEDEIMNEQEYRTMRSEIHSIEAEIFVISKQKLIDQIKNSNIHDLLVKEYEIKSKWRSQQYKNILNMKLDAINQQYTQTKKIEGEEYKQVYIDKIKANLEQNESCPSPKKSQTDSKTNQFKQNEPFNSPIQLQSSFQLKMYSQTARLVKGEQIKAQFDQSTDNKKGSQSIYYTQLNSPSNAHYQKFIDPDQKKTVSAQIQNSNFKERIQDSFEEDARITPNEIHDRNKSLTVEKSPKVKSYMLNQNRDVKLKEILSFEQRMENMKKITSIQEQSIYLQEKDSISSPKNFPNRIPSEFSTESFSEDLDKKWKYKQEIINDLERHGKPSPFFNAVTPNQKKSQELDIFKIKKEKSKPVFMKNNPRGQDLKKQNSISPSNQPRQTVDTPNSNQLLLKANNTAFQSNEQQINNNPIYNTFLHSNDSFNTSIDQNSQLLQPFNFHISPQFNHHHNNTIPSKPYDNIIISKGNKDNKTQNESNQIDNNMKSEVNYNNMIQGETNENKNEGIQGQREYGCQVDNQQIDNMKIQQQRQGRNKSLTDEQQSCKSQNMHHSSFDKINSNTNFTNWSGRSLKLTQQSKSQNFFIKNNSNIPVNLEQPLYTNNKTKRITSNFSLHSQQHSLSGQIQFIKNKSRDSISYSNSQQQLLQYNNLDVKPIYIQLKPSSQLSQRKTSSQQIFNTNSFVNQQLKTFSQLPCPNKVNSNQLIAFTPNHFHSDRLCKGKGQIDWGQDFVKEQSANNGLQDKMKNLEKECKFVNLKKILKFCKYNSKLFKQLENNTSQKIVQQDNKTDSFHSFQSKSIPQTNPKQSPLFVKPKPFKNPHSEFNNIKMFTASFLTAQPMSLHMSKKASNNA